VFVPDVIFSATTTFNVIGAFISLGYVCAVLTFAFFTEVIIVFPAAVATIPITTGVVVIIITVLVTLPFDISALVLDFLNTFVAFVFELAVPTFATLLFVTIIVVVFYPTAIAVVPATPTVIIIVIAISVACVRRFGTFATAFVAAIALFTCFLKGGIPASTFFAELDDNIVLFAAAVASVPTTYTNVVGVVTGSVFDPGDLYSLL